MHEKCGVVGVSVAGDRAAEHTYYALHALQHRGQEAAGIATHDGFQQHEQVDTGLVGEVFDEAALDSLTGGTAVGHVRYPTAGGLGKDCAQPFTVSFGGGALALCHNGNLVNAEVVRRELAADGHAFSTDSDTEVLAHELAGNLVDDGLVAGMRQAMQRLDGSYSLTGLYDDTVFGVRDPRGNRPLCIGELDEGFVLASESAALDVVGAELVRDVEPGELVTLSPDGIDAHQLVEEEHAAHCFFEYVYFARPDSEIDGRLVYDARRDIGRQLWEEEGGEDSDVVVPVPDSGRAFASGYAEAAGDGVEFAEGLMKNRYVGRTFIMPSQDERERAVRLKLNPIRDRVEGRTVTVVDDSIVRGTTSRELVGLLREAGAEEVHVRIGAPPIRAPCYLGIDMETRDELIAAGADVGDVEEEIEADSLGYVSVEGMLDVIGLDDADACLGCLTGEYPYDVPGEAADRDGV